MYYFCTYFDSNFLAQGLTLYQSLMDHCGAFKLWVLCLDEKCFEVLEDAALQGLVPVPLEQLEAFDPDLANCKSNRNLIEYYFTCTAAFTTYVISENRQVELITYLDADLYFFADPAPIYRELEGHSIGIIGHRFPDRMEKLNRYGIYNVAWVSFRKNDSGLSCLTDWRSNCIEWCYDRLEGDRFADQKYLDKWPEQYEGVRVIEHKGANLAPWNVARFHIAANDSVTVDSQPLLFYHFHGLKKVAYLPLFNTSLGDNRAVLNRPLRKRVYIPYLLAMAESRRKLRGLGYDSAGDGDVRGFVNNLWSGAMVRTLARIALVIYSVFACRAYIHFADR
jgi:hypothetical protein